MRSSSELRQVLAVAEASESELLRGLFRDEALHAWEPQPVDTFEQARFVLQHTSVDVVLVSDGLCQRESEGLAWLARQREVPVVFLADPEPNRIAQAYQDGIHAWLPRTLALADPPLLAATLERVAEWSGMRRGRQQDADTLRHCRRQIDRLVGILWRTLPMNADQPWLSQRHLLVRLQEEIARAERHGAPLAVAIGEVHRAPLPGEAAVPHPVMGDWTAQRIVRSKRRGDVAGQYGPDGFLLVLVHTPHSGAVTCCRRLQRVLEAVPAVVGHGPHEPVRAYFGIANFSPGATVKGLLQNAEQHLELAKGSEEALAVG